HLREQSARQYDDRFDVQSRELALAPRRRRGKRAVDCDPGVVHEQFDLALAAESSASTPARVERSATSASSSPPWRATSSARTLNRSVRRATANTGWPRAASPSAKCRPTPGGAPVPPA